VSTTVGLLAGLLTTGCWLPQLLRSWRTRSTGDISWTYLAVLTAGVGLWFVYGVMTAAVAVIATNVATVVALLTLATFKARFERRPEKAV
jgi:MtN3 and saliva related transmembrane protein